MGTIKKPIKIDGIEIVEYHKEPKYYGTTFIYFKPKEKEIKREWLWSSTSGKIVEIKNAYF
jgi:hypothetical protein